MPSTLNIKLVSHSGPIPYGPAEPSIHVAFGSKGYDDAAFRHYCDGVGAVSIENLAPGLYTVHPRAKGYSADPLPVTLPKDGQIMLEMEELHPAIQRLKVDGWDIRTEDGKRYVHTQATNYLHFQKWLEGREDAERTLYPGFDGYNVTFLMSLVPKQVGMKELRPENYEHFYDAVDQYFDWMAARGKRVEATLLCDCNLMNVDHAWQVRHTEHMYEVIRSKTNVLCQLANEPEKNGVDYGRFVQPNGVFWSRGSSLAGQPCPLPAGNYSTAHLTRQGAGTYLDAQSLLMITGYTGYPGTGGPTIINETRGASNTENSDRRTTNPAYFFRIARAASAWAGMTFHMDQGIHTEPLDPGSPQDLCRQSFLVGITGKEQS